jgi:hypothetical protein
VDGRAYSQPLTLRLDPRVKTAAAELARVAALSREMYDGAIAANAAYEAARALVARLEALGDADARTLKAEVEALAPAPRPQGAGGFGGAAPAGPPTLESLRQVLMGAAMAMQDAEVAPTAREVAACDAARTQYAEVMARWEELNARRR